MKICSCCKAEKPFSDFQVRKLSKDGFTASCRLCLKERDRARYPKEKERRKQNHADYMASTKGKEVHKAAVEKWKQQNKVKRAANVLLGNAVRSGKIVPLPCWICGEKAEAHHPDYDQPLSVIWLCPSHHKQAHALIRK